jgi:hypothetical protein
MSPEDARIAAQGILDKRAGENTITVLVDNPHDCTLTIKAFKKLGCKVKIELDGTRLIITRGA